MSELHYCTGVFVRHKHGHSIVWSPRTGCCIEIANAESLLESIRKKQCIVDCLESCEYEIVSELKKASLVEEGDTVDVEREIGGGCNQYGIMKPAVNDDAEYSLFGDFCLRYGIAADLHLDLTDACTERCVHCYVPKNQHHFLPYELVEKAIREFRDSQGVTVHITGGECMMHPDFERVCELCKSLNVNIIIFSNLTCCDMRRVEFLREIDPQFINVSLYSMDSKEHDAITGLRGSWRRTVNAILACHDAGVHCRIAAPLLKINRHAFLGLKSFAESHHMHFVPSADIVAQSDHDCQNLINACSADEMKQVMKEAWSLFNHYDDVKMPLCDEKVCDIGVGRMYLNAQGNYYPCNSMHDYVLGNVRENAFDEVWHGEKLEYLRSLKNRDFGACASCENRPWCKVCPAANFNATRNLFAHPSGQCEYAKVVREIYGEEL